MNYPAPTPDPDREPELVVVEPHPVRPEHRRIAGAIVITAAVGLALGSLLRQPTMMGANDISRWCTVWSLVERGVLHHRRVPLAV